MSTFQPDLSHAQLRAIGTRLAEERLPQVNEIQEPARPRDTFYTRHGKRILDFIIGGIAFVILLPVNLVLGIAALIDVGRPLFFRQKRVGRNGELFTIVKFRNMRNTYDRFGDLLPPNQRVTKWGKFVRKTSLDELLNFWSIVKGDMSLIGPRPLPQVYTGRYSDRHRARLAVKPGLECPPHDAASGARTWQNQLENDVWYVENISFATDCKMLVNLVRFTLDRKNAQVRAHSQRGTFMGYDQDGIAINDAQIPEEYLTWAKETVHE